MTDFPKIIRQLEQAGYRQKDIAKQAGCDPANINRIKNHNQTPSYPVGHNILILSEVIADPQ